MNIARFRQSVFAAGFQHTALLFLSAVACLLLALPAHADDRRVERRVPPVYPEIAKRMRISGIVHVEATVAADGNVTAAKATAGNKMLSPAAEDAVKRWKFVPGDSPATVGIDINFEAN
jgi:TonB family protein